MSCKISIIMPCYNEEKFIANAIESLVDDYVRENAEILVVDGGSKDNTIKIVEKLIRKGYPIGLLKNERKLQCYGLNLGISEARGEIIARVDAHSTYPGGYVKNLVELLETTDAANVGGVMLPKGRTPVQQAIALAMQHPVGVGDAKFHLGNFKGYVDTVYLGTFKKDIFDTVGLYDTNAHPNEDAELNVRLLTAGRKIYLDSSIQVEYFPRDSFKKLAVQYFRYGRGRAYTTTKHRLITSYRQLMPPLLVICLLISLVLSFFNPLSLAFWGCYILALLAAGLVTWPGRYIPVKIRLLMSAAFMVMHISWGMGFLSFFTTKTRRTRRNKLKKE
ncbi:MAG: glycosyltransferase [Candidatus Aminicenantes bacterium]|nr:glycosyltransferase [Candidatus Aminicenantes bacterium]NIM81055.1 glycosyltransferase [Candidatus Aminicenantes bacterium]NIN20432.1 glycosyltransferase [Candidatus Aminicenantes bacterium]NIN44205.1 glycosyltransferase [Candidatus Aminicenantes bacterium]NIN87023.1 glycosyltransferase [Candidatus Aminicenantes bacterium]